MLELSMDRTVPELAASGRDGAGEQSTRQAEDLSETVMWPVRPGASTALRPFRVR
jgi:hypothetical protein